jgi:hypothetical protein
MMLSIAPRPYLMLWCSILTLNEDELSRQMIYATIMEHKGGHHHVSVGNLISKAMYVAILGRFDTSQS